MNYKNLEKTAMCYKCKHKAICKIVYQADDLGIQSAKWNCSHYSEEKPQGKEVIRYSACHYNEKDNVCNMKSLATIGIYKSKKTNKIYADFIFLDGSDEAGFWTNTKEIFPHEWSVFKKILLSIKDEEQETEADNERVN